MEYSLSYRLGAFKGGAFDPDAADYFARIVTAGSTISPANQLAVNAFVKGCKTDGIWSAIKASCLLAGPDDLAGALVPLVGSAPTNYNFVSGDYNRTTGLVGDGSTKYLNSNRTNDADPQNNKHAATWCTDIGVAIGTWVGAGGGDAGATGINRSRNTRHNSNVADTGTGDIVTGFAGITRSAAATYTRRQGGSNEAVTRTSETPANLTYYIFANNTSSGTLAYSDSRLSFYSIGESLDLALLDARLATYMSALS